MKRPACKEVLILLVGLVCAGMSGGCAGFKCPRIDPSGERFFVTQSDISDPNAPGSGFRDYPGEKKSTNTSAVILCPGATVAPVGSEVIMLAGVRGEGQYLRTNERVEWMLSPQGVGSFVEVDNGSWKDPIYCDFTRARKIDNNYAVNSTSRRLLRMTRGTEKLDDDVHVLRGQAWVTVSSPVEGVSDVTAYAPNVYGWESRKDSARIHWVDAQWQFPAPQMATAGSTRALTTTVARHTDGTPRAGWLVRYEIVGGAAAGFAPSGGQSAEVQTDISGKACVEIVQTEPAAGTTRVLIKVICPAGMCGAELREPVTVGSGCALATWSAADISVRTSGPAAASVGATLDYRLEVSNPGDLAAEGVTVSGAIPSGMSYVSSNPPAEESGGTLRWRIDRLEGGRTRHFEVRYRAERSGTVEVCAEATASTGISATDCVLTRVDSPSIEVELRGPTEAEVGARVTYEVVVSNRSGAPVEDLVIKDSFDPGFRHPVVTDNVIKRSFGNLGAGKSRSIGVEFDVIQAGRLCHEVTVTGPGGVSATDRVCLDATERTEAAEEHSPSPWPDPPEESRWPDTQPSPGPVPTLDASAMTVEIVSPPSCAVGDEPKFEVWVTNNSNVMLTGVEVACLVDRPFYVLKATTGHRERPADGALVFSLPDIPPGEVGLISEVLCRCVSASERACFFTEVTCREVGRKTSEACVAIGNESPGGLRMTVVAMTNPVNLGRGLTCQIHVTNLRTVVDRNVEVEVTVPAEMVIDPLRTHGPSPCRIDGETIRFEPVDTLLPNATEIYYIRLKARETGDVELRTSVTSYNVDVQQAETVGIRINP